MGHSDNNETKEIERLSNEIANNLINAFVELNKASEQATKCISSAIRTATASAVVSEMERLVHKYEQASFITRWYWKRRIKKLCLSIDELETILNAL